MQHGADILQHHRYFPWFDYFAFNQSVALSGSKLLASGTISQGDFSLNKWWFIYNKTDVDHTQGNKSTASAGANTMLWITTGLEGNYSVVGYVNDTYNQVNDSYSYAPATIHVFFYTTTTTTTTTLPRLNSTFTGPSPGHARGACAGG